MEVVAELEATGGDVLVAGDGGVELTTRTTLS